MSAPSIGATAGHVGDSLLYMWLEMMCAKGQAACMPLHVAGKVFEV